MKNKTMKILKRILIAIIILMIVIVIATIGIGNYFVNYAIYRNGDGGDRQVKEEVVEVSSTEEQRSTIEKNREEAYNLAQAWKDTLQNRAVEIQAKDGIALRGTEYLLENKENNKWTIILHGYHPTPDAVLTIGEHFSKQGYNRL